MKKFGIILGICITALINFVCFGQDIVLWSPDYEITIEDFKSNQTELNPQLTTYSAVPGVSIDFSFSNNVLGFAIKKNFNKEVRAVLNRDASVIISPNEKITKNLIEYCKYYFDLTELYARIFRKKIHEEKKAFSKGDFFQKYFYELQEEMINESARIYKQSNLAKNADIFIQERDKIRRSIDSLNYYCNSCKIPKNKKKKKP